MKDKIIEYLLKSTNKKITFDILKSNFCDESTQSFIDFNKTLNNLLDDNIIFKEDKYFKLVDNIRYKIGVVEKSNYSIVIRSDNKIYYPTECFKQTIRTIVGDTVLFEVIIHNEYNIIKMIHSTNQNFVCVSKYSRKRNEFIYKCDLINDYKLIINNEKKFKVKDNDYLSFRIVKRNNKELLCDIIENLGNKNTVGNDITKLLIENKVRMKFNKDIDLELKQFNDKINPNDFNNRVDLTNEFTVTIDGDDAKDFDDAISINKQDEHYNLKVHIADVSYYVSKDSALDKEAYKRGTSLYVCDRVVPMLPFKLSNELCSLKPNINRLTVTCDMNIDYSGEIIDYKIYESIINSDYRMTYSNVNKLFDNDIEILERYKQHKNKFYDMLTLSKIIRKKRFDEGAIDFEKDEAKAILDKNGFPIDYKIRERGQSEKMIEDFMITANVCVAKHMMWSSIPNVYRTHNDPKEIELHNFISYVNKVGYKVKGKNYTSLSLQTCLNHFIDKPEYIIVKELLLKSMQKAVYSNQCLGHFGLGLKEYCHFTSPIRRYPDLLVARMIKKYIINNNGYDNTDKDEKYLETASSKCSMLERQAISVERKVDDMKKAEYMSQFIGHKFSATITSVHHFGFFVELENTIEGLVRTSDFPIYLDYNNVDNCYYNEEYNVSYTLGQKVNVTCNFASKDTGKIGFSLNINNLNKKIKRWI